MVPLAVTRAWLAEASEPDVAVALGGGLGGPLREGDPLRPWPDPLWWLEDWLPPCCPTPPLSLERAPEDLA